MPRLLTARSAVDALCKPVGSEGFHRPRDWPAPGGVRLFV